MCTWFRRLVGGRNKKGEIVMDSTIRFKNLTPHAVTIRVGCLDLVIPPSGWVAQVNSYEIPSDPIGGIATVRRVWETVEGLPYPVNGVVYLVSPLVLEHVRGRDDVLAPDTGPTAIRDAAGQIEAVQRLIRAGDRLLNDCC
jgi:hypothetical protein